MRKLLNITEKGIQQDKVENGILFKESRRQKMRNVFQGNSTTWVTDDHDKEDLIKPAGNEYKFYPAQKL